MFFHNHTPNANAIIEPNNPIIQNSFTISLSFHPFFSNLWCSGAIGNNFLCIPKENSKDFCSVYYQAKNEIKPEWCPLSNMDKIIEDIRCRCYEIGLDESQTEIIISELNLKFR